VTLVFRNGEYQPSEFTYPDFRLPHYRAAFKEIRAHLAQQLQMPR
jgi:hypothetical protein